MSSFGDSDRATLGPYRIGRLLGRGGMGEVYEAVDSRKNRTVALKVLAGHLVDDETFGRRFLRESETAARLRSPHVVPIHDFGEIDGRLFLDMRLIDGHDLRSVLLHGRLAPTRAVHIVEQIATALDDAHRNGLIHRDVKPENILLTDDDFAYLVDFGLAQTIGDTRLTSTGSAIGSFAYMAPERFGPAAAGPASDVYALTCVFFEALAGTQPFDSSSIEGLIGSHLQQPPPLLRNGFDAVIAHGMAKNPTERFASASALAAAARSALDAPAHAATMVAQVPSPAPTELPSSRQARTPLLAIALVLAAVLLVVGAAVTYALTRDSGATTDAAATTAADPAAVRTTPFTVTETAATTVTATHTATAGPGDRTAGDLGLAVPISRPPCDGAPAVFVANAVSPGEYANQVRAALTAHPGSRYLRTDESCASLRQSLNGNPIYAVYFTAADVAAACARRAAIGGDSYVRRLDNVTPVNTELC